MKILILLLFVYSLIPLRVISQSWEFYEENPDFNEHISHALEYEQGNLISISTQFHPVNKDTFHFKSMIRVHDIKTGQVTNEVMYEIDTLSARLNWIFYNEAKRIFIIAGDAKDIKPKNNRGYFLVTVWDEDLNMLSDTIVRLEPNSELNRFYYYNGNFRKEKDYLIVGYYSDNYVAITQGSKLFISKLTSDGEIELIKWYNASSFNPSIFYDSLLNRYIMFGVRTIFLNDDFEKIDSLELFGPDYVRDRGQGLGTMIDSARYLVSCAYHDRSLGLAILANNMKYVKGTKIPSGPGMNDFHFFSQNFDFIDTSEIFFGTYPISFNYYAVSKVNSNMDAYWLKYYSSSEDFQHEVWSIVATSDGGCVLTGGKGSYNIYTTIESAWALKLDADGNTVSTKDHSPTRWEITVYPNPSSGDFRIEIAGEVHSAVLMLFDMQGRQVRHYDQLSEGSHTFDFYGLPAGAYVWKLLCNGEVLGDGKWIKGR